LDDRGHLVRYYQTAEGGEVAKQRQSATFTFHLNWPRASGPEQWYSHA
jgi:hypothetical protein